MSTRTRLAPVTLPTIDMSLASTASSATILQGLSMMNYSISWTGATPVGTIALEFSDDYALSANGEGIANAGTWNIAPLDVSGVFSTSIALSGNTGNGMIDIAASGAYASRLLYTKTSGTGTLTVVVTGKVA